MSAEILLAHLCRFNLNKRNHIEPQLDVTFHIIVIDLILKKG